MAICPIIVHFSTSRARSMHDVACKFARAMRSKDAQKQLARTSLKERVLQELALEAELSELKLVDVDHSPPKLFLADFSALEIRRSSFGVSAKLSITYRDWNSGLSALRLIGNLNQFLTLSQILLTFL